MTYADDLAALGAQVDQKIATITQQGGSTLHNDQGRVLGTQWDADIAAAVPPPPPPPPKTVTKLGCSPGIPGVAKVQATYDPHVWRSFTPQQVVGIPARAPICYSNDQRRPDLYKLATGTTVDASLLAELKQVLRDDAVHYWILLHEEDIHGANIAQWKAVYKGARRVLDQFNASRTNKVLLTSCTTGMPFDTQDYKNWDCPEVDVLGMDNYNRHHWDTMHAWATSLGKPWCAPETGIKAAAVPATTYTDAAVLTAMNADFAQYNGKAAFICQYMGGGCDLTPHPQSSARWAQLVGASG